MHEIPLHGCRPEPLMSYLKALGVLRLVAEQKDPEARGRWAGVTFILRSALDKAALESFFLNDYRPTPIVAPWAGGCGFFAKDNRKAVDKIATSNSPRFAEYEELIKRVRRVLTDEGLREKPDPQAKERLLRRYRASLPDESIAWMDCVLVLQNKGQAFPPLLGTGGNDGRLDFTRNFMERLVEVGIAGGDCTAAAGWLRNALFHDGTKGLSSSAVGQFAPGQVGGPNATQGMEGNSAVNPWDFILMMEGALLLAGSAVRRMGLNLPPKAAFPFTVDASPVGQGAVDEADSSSARGEIWLPLWDRFASLAELRHVFSSRKAWMWRVPSVASAWTGACRLSPVSASSSAAEKHTLPRPWAVSMSEHELRSISSGPSTHG